MTTNARRLFAPLLIGALLGGVGAAAAKEDGPVACASLIAPTGELAPWASPTDTRAAGEERMAAGSPIEIGKAARLALLPTAEVRYPAPPGKAGDPDRFGGLAMVDISVAGNYRIALGSPAWVDLAASGKAVASTAHRHGPDCSGVRKMVDFAVQPGRYTLQIAASSEAAITVLVARLP